MRQGRSRIQGEDPENCFDSRRHDLFKFKSMTAKNFAKVFDVSAIPAKPSDSDI
jgi:hypothetical protein